MVFKLVTIYYVGPKLSKCTLRFMNLSVVPFGSYTLKTHLRVYGPKDTLKQVWHPKIQFESLEIK